MREQNVFKGAAAGLISGLIGTLAMSQFQNIYSKVKNIIDESNKEKENNQSGDPLNQNVKSSQKSEPATVKAAEKISESLLDHKLKPEEKEIAGPLMHYTTGTLTGALYGAAAELQPAITAGAGSAYGTGFWLIADNIAVPALKLSDPPQDYPVSTHLYALASHLVYGVTTELTRRVIRKVL